MSVPTPWLTDEQAHKAVAIYRRMLEAVKEGQPVLLSAGEALLITTYVTDLFRLYDQEQVVRHRFDHN